MGLQVVYFALAIYGWANWLRGGTGGTALPISRTLRWEWMTLFVFVIAGTIGLRAVLIAAGGAAPLWDALTTALSLAAQYLLCRKRLENWFFWIAADIVYIPLYVSRSLPLTAILYAVFLVMCFAGLRSWRRTWSAQRSPA
jgi:nicotinamide mononucleotide transporter